MTTPLFQDLCIDFDTLLQQPCLKTMLSIADKQSKTKEAMLKTDPLNYEEHQIEHDCPLYFGMFTEWLCQHFLNQFGSYWNIENVKMVTDTNNSARDVGIDGNGITPSQITKYVGKKPKPNAHIFIQVKGTLNPNKVYKPNDGSRLGNFFAAAQHEAKKMQQSYTARYLVIHTGKSLNHWFSNYADYEEINFKGISGKMDGSWTFLNQLRTKCGLEPLTIPTIELDNMDI